jgi:hypothetical protein
VQDEGIDISAQLRDHKRVLGATTSEQSVALLDQRFQLFILLCNAIRNPLFVSRAYRSSCLLD